MNARTLLPLLVLVPAAALTACGSGSSTTSTHVKDAGKPVETCKRFLSLPMTGVPKNLRARETVRLTYKDQHGKQHELARHVQIARTPQSGSGTRQVTFCTSDQVAGDVTKAATDTAGQLSFAIARD